MQIVTFRLEPKTRRKLKREPSQNRRWNNRSEIIRSLVDLYLHDQTVHDLIDTIAEYREIHWREYTMKTVSVQMHKPLIKKMDAEVKKNDLWDFRSEMMRRLVELYLEVERIRRAVHNGLVKKYADEFLETEL